MSRQIKCDSCGRIQAPFSLNDGYWIHYHHDGTDECQACVAIRLEWETLEICNRVRTSLGLPRVTKLPAGLPLGWR